jgi:hypothetical protein
MNNERLKVMAPKDCYFVDEITAAPKGYKWDDDWSWLALAVEADGE